MFSSSFRNHTADFAKNADFSSYEYLSNKIDKSFPWGGEIPWPGSEHLWLPQLLFPNAEASPLLPSRGQHPG